MYELIQAKGNSYYIDCPTKMGLYKTGPSSVCLIDSGNGRDTAKKVRQILETNHWQLSAIYLTHSHADHVGGGKFLQEATGCRIFAPGIEAVFARHPILQPSYLYGGFAPRDLRHKFLLAQPSDTEYLSEKELPRGWSAFPLPGHFFDMVGYRTPEDIVFLGDCLSSKETLDKYQINFVYDVEASLKTLEQVKTMEGALFVPAHAPATENISPLAQYNIDKTLEVAEAILDICASPCTFEEILQKLFSKYEMAMTFEQHALVGSSVRSYLSWLRDKDELEVAFDDNLLFWFAV